MKKLKVLQIIPSFGVGGAQKLVLDYLYYMNNSEVEIKAISMYENQNSIYDKFIEDNGLDVVYLDKKPGLDLSIIKKIKKVVQDFKPDVIHTHMYTIKYTIFSVIGNKKVKLFHTIHNEPEKDAGRIDKIFNKFAFKYLNCTPIALTDKMLNKTNKYYNVTNTIVLNNGIILEKFENKNLNKNEIRDKLNIPRDSFVVGHIGRFMKQKNHEFIIKVFKRISEVEENSYLLLVGDGELKKNIELKVKELGLKGKVKFFGIRNDIPDILNSLDVFIFPSLHEGFPIALIEAQAAGIRCVIADTIDSKVILSENTVTLNLNDSIEKWSEVIRNKSIKSTNYGNLEDYDIKHIVKKLLELYRNTKK
ncbi:glycosyltransferase [Caldibacillus thermoamylovorans]|uniref:glycosyltransferase n=1 Tax=Caldibacillus thermoamylovorans TaxID=35841 RepID=UPI0012699DDB|nr:glycosyltransferase [Caldibacillus thermoamylovorans]